MTRSASSLLVLSFSSEASDLNVRSLSWWDRDVRVRLARVVASSLVEGASAGVVRELRREEGGEVTRIRWPKAEAANSNPHPYPNQG